MLIGVVAAGADETALGVQLALTRLGARVVFIDTSTVSLALREDGRAWEGDYGAVYVKSQHLAVPLFDVEHLAQRKPKRWPARWVAEREHHAAVTSALRALELRGAHFVNSVEKFEVHLLKPLQTVVLKRAAVPVPASLTTNDADSVRAFAEAFGDVIYKTPAGGALVRRLSKEDLSDARLARLATAPVLFQQRIEGDELRVTMLDGKCVGAWKLPARGVVDAREVLERAKKVKCPADVEKTCARAAKALGLVFTSVDVRVSEDGVPYVLECNPTPSVASYEAPKTSPVLKALARYLFDAAEAAKR
jgi:glutathione synthase/RimK-type ligase-like ATP-grasp enzyme